MPPFCQSTTAFIDSTGYCLFIAFPILDIPKGWEGMAESVAGVTGQPVTGQPKGKGALVGAGIGEIHDVTLPRPRRRLAR